MFNQICVFFTLFVIQIKSVTVVAPTWITSSYIQAGSKKIINGDTTGTTTGNSSTPTGTLTFTTSFSQIPNLGYGISGYQGNFVLT